jgi:3-hydroxyacyl-CoA dehydrogenase
MKIKTVTILGANGTMGSNVSGIFASFGNAKVYMVSRIIEDSFEAKKKAALSVRSEAIQRNLIPKGYEDLSECINESDLIFESVSEDFSVKEKIIQKIKGCLQTEPLIATGSSGLSIQKLSSLLPERLKSRFMGIHFYNPPYNLPACEVIPSEYTDDQVLEATKNYLSGVLFRKVIQVKDSPAFLGNRIGFFFINKAMIFAEKYKAEGGTDYIDAILGPFSGRSMPPLVTSNFVGLDVHKAIVDNVFLNSHDPAIKSFKLWRRINRFWLLREEVGWGAI